MRGVGGGVNGGLGRACRAAEAKSAGALRHARSSCAPQQPPTLPARAPLDLRNVAVKGAADVVEIGKDKGLGHIKSAGDDVLGVLPCQPPRLLDGHAPVAVWGRGCQVPKQESHFFVINLA